MVSGTVGPGTDNASDPEEGIQAGRDRDPAWSPDGTKVAFTRHHNECDRIFIMNPGGSDVVRLSGGRYDRHPAWTPDGRKTAFTGPWEFTDVWVAGADGSGRRNLTETPPTTAREAPAGRRTAPG